VRTKRPRPISAMTVCIVKRSIMIHFFLAYALLPSVRY
jgi:hypothetical protein